VEKIDEYGGLSIKLGELMYLPDGNGFMHLENWCYFPVGYVYNLGCRFAQREIVEDGIYIAGTEFVKILEEKLKEG
jgi:hypothetical protein